MKFHTLVLEGNKKTEEDKRTEHLPAYTKSAHLQRKRAQKRNGTVIHL